MRLSSVFSLFSAAVVCDAYRFQAENLTVAEPTNLPIFYNLSSSQIQRPQGSSSFYSSSFLTTTDRRQYMVLSHVLVTSAPESYARSSIIEITNPTNYWSHLEYHPTPTTLASSTGQLNISFSNYEFRALSDDGFSLLRTSTTTPAFAFNITFAATSPLLLNAGIGTFSFGTNATNQWSLPAGRTAGTLTLNGTQHAIDARNSLTWYDRQWGAGALAAGNWTWLELHFDDSDIKASVWAIDQHPGAGDVAPWRFATIRHGEDARNSVVAHALLPDAASTWTSPRSGIAYSTRWTLDFGNGDVVEVASVREDQEIYSEAAVSDSAYQGFVTVEGTFLGKHRKGFGLVEQVDTRT